MFEKFCFWCNEDYEIDPSNPAGLVDKCPKCASNPPVLPTLMCPTCSRAMTLPVNASSKVGKKFRCAGKSTEGWASRTGAAPGNRERGTILKCNQLCRLVVGDTDTGFALEAVNEL